MALDLTCTTAEKILVTVNPTTQSGAPAQLDGPVGVEVTSGDATFEMVDDRSFFVVSSDLPGPSTYVVTGDADLGAGVVAIADSINFNVAGELASNLGLSAGAPEPK